MSLEAVIVVAGTIATVIAVAALAARLPAGSRPPAPRPRAERRSPPSQLLRIERIAERASESSLAAHTQLRPVLIQAAESRLARRGVTLEDEEEARRLLGPEVWDIVHPGLRAPPDGPGIAPSELDAILDRLEAL